MESVPRCNRLPTRVRLNQLRSVRHTERAAANKWADRAGRRQITGQIELGEKVAQAEAGSRGSGKQGQRVVETEGREARAPHLG